VVECKFITCLMAGLNLW